MQIEKIREEKGTREALLELYKDELAAAWAFLAS